MEALEPIRGIDIYLLDQFLKGRLRPNMRVLDAGCGSGRNIRWLLGQGMEVSGFDANPEVISRLQAEFPERKGHFWVGKVEASAAADEYDFVICNAVLHFAENDAHFEAMFAGLVKRLAPGGLLFIRMTSNIGLEDQLGPGQSGVFLLPDGSTRYLLRRAQVDALRLRHGLDLIEPVKTVFVDGLRSMTTLVLQRNS